MGNSSNKTCEDGGQSKTVVAKARPKILTSPAASDFLRAARAGDLQKMTEMLDSGSVDVAVSNSNGLNALHLAAKEGHIEIINELLRRGIDINLPTGNLNTALHIAALAGRLDVVTVLVKHGAFVNVRSKNGFTPLYMAAQENFVDIVRVLLRDGLADQHLATTDGFSPLDVAKQQGNNEIVDLLTHSGKT